MKPCDYCSKNNCHHCKCNKCIEVCFIISPEQCTYSAPRTSYGLAKQETSATIIDKSELERQKRIRHKYEGLTLDLSEISLPISEIQSGIDEITGTHEVYREQDIDDYVKECHNMVQQILDD